MKKEKKVPRPSLVPYVPMAEYGEQIQYYNYNPWDQASQAGWHPPMAQGQDPSQMPNQMDNSQPTGVQGKPKKQSSGPGFKTPGTGDLFTAGLQFANGLIPDHQSSNMYHQRRFGNYNPYANGYQNSQAIYDDGGMVNYRKHNIAVSYEQPSSYPVQPAQPYQLPEVTITGERVHKPMQRSISYEPVLNQSGQVENYSPIFHNYSSGDIQSTMQQLPQSYGNIPVEHSYDLWRERQRGFHQNTMSNQWTPSTDYSQPGVQQYVPYDYMMQMGGMVGMPGMNGYMAKRYYNGGDTTPDEEYLYYPQDMPEASSGLSSAKAKEILRDGTAQGHKLTAKQKRYFGWIAGGGKGEDGMEILPPLQDENMLVAKSGIHIKKSHRGRFTEYKKRTGKTTEQALHSKDSHVRQMANFARNAKHFKHQWGGRVSSLKVGDEINLTEQEMIYYKSIGYEFE